MKHIDRFLIKETDIHKLFVDNTNTKGENTHLCQQLIFEKNVPYLVFDYIVHSLLQCTCKDF